MLDERLQIRYVDLTFMLEIERRGTLPRNKVSALRGGLGQMLLEQNFQINICKKGLENALFLRLSEGCCGNEEKPEWASTQISPSMFPITVFRSGNEEKPEMEVNHTSFKTNLSFDEILSKMNSGNPHDSVDENEERQFFR